MFEGYAPHTDSLHVVGCKIRYVLPEYFDVFRLKPIAGRLDVGKWKYAEVPMPVLMSKELADSLFGTSGPDVIGKTCFNPYWMNKPNPSLRVTNYQVMAVLPSHKLDEYQRYEPFIYLPTPNPYPLFWQHMAIRVHPDYVAGFEERFRKDMQGTLERGMFYMDYIQSYADMKEAFDIEQGTVNYLNTTYAVIAFFLFNVFLSILGTFWFRTHKRKSEIALRMAMGCSRQGILKHYLTEGWLLLLVAAVPALIICFNIQMGDLTVHTLMDVTSGRFFGCFLVAVGVLALIVAIGIGIPARKAMKIDPAEALHNE
jgi:putative ABC transport system permease protein